MQFDFIEDEQALKTQSQGVKRTASEADLNPEVLPKRVKRVHEYTPNESDLR